jgi:hypothetical protein
VVIPSSIEKGKFLIPIPKRSQGDLSFQVEIIYHVSLKEKWKKFSSFHLPLPQIKGLPVDQTFLTLRLPQDSIYIFSDKNNLNPSTSSEIHWNIANQMSEEFMDLVNLRKEAGYGDDKKISSQKRYFSNQQKLLSSMNKNLERARNEAENSVSPHRRSQLRKIENLEQQLKFYQEDLQNSSQKLQESQQKKSPFMGGYQQNIFQDTQSSALDAEEKGMNDAVALHLRFRWEGAVSDRENLDVKIPASSHEKVRISGPAYFPASETGFQVHHFHKAGGNPEMSFQIYPRQTKQGGKILVAILAAFLLLLSAYKNNWLNFSGNSDLEKCRNALLIIALSGMIVLSFIWYIAAVIFILVSIADLFYKFKKWEKEQAK